MAASFDNRSTPLDGFPLSFPLSLSLSLSFSRLRSPLLGELFIKHEQRQGMLELLQHLNRLGDGIMMSREYQRFEENRYYRSNGQSFDHPTNTITRHGSLVNLPTFPALSLYPSDPFLGLSFRDPNPYPFDHVFYREIGT